MLTNLFRPADETLTIPLQVGLVVRRHMLLHCAVLIRAAMESQMAGDAGARKKISTVVRVRRTSTCCLMHSYGTEKFMRSTLI